jgi:predicted PurR-regulated permease PerM
VINLNVSTATRWGLNALILLSVVVALYLGRAIFIPAIMAVLLAAMLWPIVAWLNQCGIPLPGFVRRIGFPWVRPSLWRLKTPWGLACLGTVGGLVLCILLLTAGFGVSVSKFVLDIGSQDKQRDMYVQFRAKAQSMWPAPIPENDRYFNADPDHSEILTAIRSFFDLKKDSFVNMVASIGYSSTDLLWEVILILFVLLFLLIEGRMLSRHLVAIFGPSEKAKSRAVAALKDMANQIRSYLVWRTTINFAMGLILGVLYELLHLSQPWTWALLTAILWYVPYIGPIVAGFPPVLDAFISCDPWIAVGVLVFYILFVILEGYFIVPVVMGRSMELNATTVMLACLFWQLVWGVPGLFLAMPLMAAVRTICMHVPDWHPWANLMGTREDPPAPKHEPEPEAAAEDGFFEDTQILTGAELQAQLKGRAAKAQESEKT